MKSILVVTHEQKVFRDIKDSFGPEPTVSKVSTRDKAIETLKKIPYDFIFIDVEILRGDVSGDGYKSALQSFWHVRPGVEVIVMSTQEIIRETVMAVKAGASNYLTYPIDKEEVKYITQSTYESTVVQSELDYLRDQFGESDSLDIIQTKSPLMKKVFDKIRSVAPTRSTVLLVGETGTGKSMLANLIHQHSGRKDGPFISVHCGAIPDTLIESELFGHEKGAFTGAVRRKLGNFEIAQGGSIFLDEIGTVTPSAQIKLLQILQDGTFHRVGGEESIKADARTISATNTDLKKMCDDGQFRRDLYYRLNVFPIEIPPLRERKEDLPLLINVFLKEQNKFYSKEIHDVHSQVLEAFEQYPWPGNIRELENLIERAYILETSHILTSESFPAELFADEDTWTQVPLDTSLTIAEARRQGIEQTERYYLKELLTENNGRIQKTADAAGITSRQLHKLMKKHGLRKEEFKSLPTT